MAQQPLDYGYAQIIQHLHYLLSPEVQIGSVTNRILMNNYATVAYNPKPESEPWGRALKIIFNQLDTELTWNEQMELSTLAHQVLLKAWRDGKRKQGVLLGEIPNYHITGSIYYRSHKLTCHFKLCLIEFPN